MEWDLPVIVYEQYTTIGAAQFTLHQALFDDDDSLVPSLEGFHSDLWAFGITETRSNPTCATWITSW